MLERKRHLYIHDALVQDWMLLGISCLTSHIATRVSKFRGGSLEVSRMYEDAMLKRDAYDRPTIYDFQHQICAEPLILEAGSKVYRRRSGRRRNLVRVLLAALVGAITIS